MCASKPVQLVASGIHQLDRILGSLLIGDNVIWYDDAGSLAWPFCANLIQSSQAQNRPVIYVSFDRSPRNLSGKAWSFGRKPGVNNIGLFHMG